MNIYMVARWIPLGHNGTYHERGRFHTHGAFLNVENARAACAEANDNLRKQRHHENWYTDHRYLHHVISYKVRDYKEPAPSWCFGQRAKQCGDCAEFNGKFYCTMNCSGGAA